MNFKPKIFTDKKSLREVFMKFKKYGTVYLSTSNAYGNLDVEYGIG